MRAVIQRVTRASVSVDGLPQRTIGMGLVVFLGIRADDGETEAGYIARKISHMRIFAQDNGTFERSVLDIGGEVMVVSQFTLYADSRKGRRPSFTEAADSARAEEIYNQVIKLFRGIGCRVVTGYFGEHMEVALVNDGPVTISIDSPLT